MDIQHFENAIQELIDKDLLNSNFKITEITEKDSELIAAIGTDELDIYCWDKDGNGCINTGTTLTIIKDEDGLPKFATGILVHPVKEITIH